MPPPRVTRSPFGITPAGEDVELYTCTNNHGLVLRAITYGATITSLEVPDREGRLGNIALGHARLEDYLAETTYRGALVGRYAGRIAGATFPLDGTIYTLAANEPPHHLHGGHRGFDKAVWECVPAADEASLGFRLNSPAGDEGYPGSLDVTVTYRLTTRDELVVDYAARSDAATPVNLTQHTYFNLAGSGDVLGHILQVEADEYVPLDDTLIPTGAMAPVEGTPFDFRAPAPLGSRIGDGRFDHTFVVRRSGPGLAPAARVLEPGSGRTLAVATTEPGIHLYTGRPAGLTLETQHFADAPNQTRFPSTILRPGSEYRSRTVYAFGVSR